MGAHSRLWGAEDPRVLLAGAVGGVLAAIAFATLAYRFGPLAVLAAVLAATALVVTLVRPAYGLAVGMAAIAFEATSVPLAGGTISPAEALLAAVGAGWIVRAVLGAGAVALPRLREVSLLVLLASVALGIAVADDGATVVRVLVLWTLFTGAYLQAQALSVDQVRAVVVSFAIGAGALGAVGALDFVQSGDVGLFSGGAATGDRAIGTFVDANYYAAGLLLAIPPTLTLILAEPRRYGWLSLPALTAIAGLLFSLSRGATAGLALALCALLVWRRARWIAFALAAAFVVLTFANANPLVETEEASVVQERLGTLSDPTAGGQRRPELWRSAAEIAADHPITGVGMGGFENEAARRGIFEHGAPLENAHNVPLEIAAGAGLFGAIAFAVFLVQLAGRALRAMHTDDPLTYALGLGLAAGLLGFVAQGLTVSHVKVPALMGAFLVVAGLLSALADRAPSR